MESALTPRDIQARIRAGESLEAVAEVAGVPAAQIRDYAAPILRELEYVVHTARASQVRRRGEASAQRRLGDVVDARMSAWGIDPATVTWSSRRDERRRWTLTVVWSQEGQSHEAHFAYDQRGRFATAANDDARLLIGDLPRPTVEVAVDPDEEPTVDLNDDLAIVRAVQEDVPVTEQPQVPASHIVKLPELEEDFAEVELTEVDGIYDIVPNPESDMDVLYEMLSGFNEDSVRIYAGLTQPVAPDVASAEPTPQTPEPTDEPRPEADPAPEPSPTAPQPGQTPTPEPEAAPGDIDEAQEALVDEPETPKPRRTNKKRKRASVPSWDEIMFGGPSGS